MQQGMHLKSMRIEEVINVGRYLKKPVEVEAFEFDGAFEDEDGWYVPDWAVEALNRNDMFFKRGSLYVHTLEGDMKASKGDFIIKGVLGELYPCKPEAFKETYVRIG